MRKIEQKVKKMNLRIGFRVDDLLSLEHDKWELLLPFLVLAGCRAVYLVCHSDKLIN